MTGPSRREPIMVLKATYREQEPPWSVYHDLSSSKNFCFVLALYRARKNGKVFVFLVDLKKRVFHRTLLYGNSIF